MPSRADPSLQDEKGGDEQPPNGLHGAATPSLLAQIEASFVVP